MYLSLSQAAEEAGVSKSTISKYLNNGKLSYVEKDEGGYKIDPAELFRVFPKGSRKGSAKASARTESNDREPLENPTRTDAYSPVLEAQLEGLRKLMAEKERRIADLETDRDQLREDRNRLSQNWQDERDRLLKVIEDAHSTMRLITDQTARHAAPAPRSLFERLVGFGRAKPPAAA